PAPRDQQQNEGGIDEDAVEPGRELGVAREAADGARRRHEGLLHGVLGLVAVPQEPARGREHAAGVLAHEGGEGVVVAAAEAVEQDGVVDRWLEVHSASPWGPPSISRRNGEHLVSTAPRWATECSRPRPCASTKVTPERSSSRGCRAPR